MPRSKKDILSLPMGFYGNGALGYFALHNEKSLETIWYHCREDFRKAGRGTKRFFYQCNYLDQIKKVLKVVENKLKLTKSKRIQIRLTNHSDVYCFDLGDFWSREVPRDFLTALLRDAEDYDDDWKSWLDGSQYFHHTEEAVERFLEGYTHCPKRKFEGWHDTFRSNRMVENPHKLLIKPKKKRKK